METTVRMAWGLLALAHLSPAAVAILPSLVERLYGVSPTGDLGVLIAHRGALFLAIFAACVLAVFDPPARRALGIVVATSVIGFLVLYLRAGAPSGPLRTIAIVDAAALLPLAFVIVAAWRPQVA
ncbi:MAG: hypothetical protein ACK5V0_08590 [Alphaproteobacteria bacterium]|jgi:hypothetical protein